MNTSDHWDNRLENLQILCPNCHALKTTKTRRGGIADTAALEAATRKSVGVQLSPPRFSVTCKCGNKVSNLGSKCKSCAGLDCQKTKITWPCKENLQKLVWEKPTKQLAQELGVSDKAIGKRCKRLNIQKPSRGYWSKFHEKT